MDTSSNTPPNWDAIAVPYRAGIMSVRQIAKAFDVALTTLQRHAKKNGWTRKDLGPRIRQATQERLTQGEPQQQGEPHQNGGIQGLGDGEGRANSFVADQSCARAQENGMEPDFVIAAASRLQADVIRTHKIDVVKAQRLVTSLLADLADTDWDEVARNLGSVYCDRLDGRKLAAALRAVDAPTRATTIKTLTAAMAELVKIERQAFNMDADGGGDDAATPLEERLAEYRRRAVIKDSGGKVVDLAGKH